MAQEQQNGEGKQDWDTRAWLVGILGGVVGGSVTAWVNYPPFAGKINAVMHHAVAVWISGAAAFLSLLVLPAVISGIARRRTFLWGFLPLTLFLAAVEAEDGVESGVSHLTANFWPALLVIGISLFVSSGPVSLFRSRHARAQRRREAAVAALAAQREAASIQQEGVWPPPPDYRQ